jgi:6-phosphogluconolactonase
MSSPQVVVVDDEDTLVDRVAQDIADRLSQPGLHHLVLTGGGVGTRILAKLAVAGAGVDWSRVHLWWGDERFLPPGDPERNETGARAALIDHVAIPEANVHPMPSDQGQGVHQAAADYADELARYSHDGFVPPFGLLLLGMGPEGHVASLFPHESALYAATSTVPVSDSPKPPPERVSLTLAAIRSAEDVWIGATGEAKADAAALAARPDTPIDDLPAAGARGSRSTVLWLDRQAASRL